MIDESSSITTTDIALRDKIAKAYDKSPAVSFDKIKKDTFFVHHSAKEVEYTVDGFREKNKDEISSAISDCILASSN